ncbi:MAG: hypothetical protein HC844_03845 [Tabrizicola sp.]|nr:hypothetical protein [Tabrizicola sp.]
MSIDPVSTGGVPLASVSRSSNAEMGAQQDLSRAFEGAIQKAVSFPVSESNPASRPNSLLVDSGANGYLREPVLGAPNGQANTAKDGAVDRQMEQVVDRFRGLYVEMTNFSVAWSVAKRSGKDVETLLRGQ